MQKILMQDYMTLVVATASAWVFQEPNMILDIIGSNTCRVKVSVSHIANNGTLYLQTATTLEGPWKNVAFPIGLVGTEEAVLDFDIDARYPLDRFLRWGATGNADWELCFAIEAELE